MLSTIAWLLCVGSAWAQSDSTQPEAEPTVEPESPPAEPAAQPVAPSLSVARVLPPDAAEVVIAVDAAGQFYLDDYPLPRDELKRRLAHTAGRDGSVVRVVADPAAPRGRDAGTLLRMLQSVGVDQPTVEMRSYTPVRGDTPIPIGAPPPRMPALAIQPVGEFRLDWRFERSDLAQSESEEGGFDHRFTVPRAMLGMKADLSPQVTTRTVFNVVESHDTVELGGPQSEVVGPVEDVVLHEDPSGWSLRLRDMYADLQPFSTDVLIIRPGVQPTILGSQGWFDTSDDAYYLVGPRTGEVAQLAGLVPDRDLGIRARGAFLGDRLVIDGMVANGTGHVGGGEDNRTKDVSARVDVAAHKRLHFVASALRSVLGTDGNERSGTWSFLTEWRLESVRLMGEYLGGAVKQGSAPSMRFVGGQGAAAAEWRVASAAVDKGVFTTRVGYFDPVATEVDAGAWLTLDASLQTWWKVKAPFGLMSGLGYGMWMPMDATAPIEHSIVLQTLWKL